MSPGRLNAVLAAVLAAVWALIWLIRPDAGRRSHAFMPEMSASLTHEAQAPSPFWSEGLPPSAPAGTIPRGHPPLGYGPGKEEAERAGRELRNPVAADPAALDRGARVFATYCAVCHGPTGLGDGPVTKAGVPAPPSLYGDSARRMADGRMFHVVTFGQGNMPAHASQVPRPDRWKAVLYVRRLQREADEAARRAAAERAASARKPPVAVVQEAP